LIFFQFIGINRELRTHKITLLVTFSILKMAKVELENIHLTKALKQGNYEKE